MRPPASSEAVSANGGSRNFRARLVEHGKGEFWAYASLLAWCVVIPAGIWSVGQTAAAVKGLQNSITVAQSVPKVKRRPLDKADVEIVGRALVQNFPSFRVEGIDGGKLRIAAQHAEQYTDWVQVMTLLPLVVKRTSWTINELCLSAEPGKCRGGAIFVEVTGERIVVTGEDKS